MFIRNQKCSYCEAVITVKARSELAANDALSEKFERHLAFCPKLADKLWMESFRARLREA